MAVDDLSDFYDVGIDILGTELSDNNTVKVQTGSVVTQQVTSDSGEWWQHVGFASRPSRAVVGQSACQGIAFNRGDHDVCFASRDIRSQQIYGNMSEGETCIYGAGIDGNAQGRISIKADGSVSLLTTDDNTEAGNGVYLKIAPDKLQFVAPWGKLTFDATGFHIITKTGARFDLGALAAPPPLDAVFGSFCRIVADTTTIDSQSVFIGPSAGTYQSALYSLTPPLTVGSPLIVPNMVLPPSSIVGLVSASPGSPVTMPAAGAIIGATIPSIAGSGGVFIGL